jgi:NAD(P)-dependent dehydrogenase (short-subunit alcohol dehydrogenase family)
MRRLTDRVALVTGAASGIGQAVALRFADEGARVVAVDLNADGVAETVARVEATGGQALAVAADVSAVADVQRAIDHTLEHWGSLDVVFNGVGISGRRWGDGPVDQCTEEAWERVLTLNLTSMFLVCKYAVRAMLASGGGSIINLSSVLGMVGGDEDFATHAYATSKGGIISLSRSMAVTYARKGIRVNVIAPGLIATPMSLRAQSDPHIQERLVQLQPLTGTMGTPEDIAGAVAYLASDDARFVTGLVLTVDGGWTAQ